MADRAELKRLALAATRGPWEAGEEHPDIYLGVKQAEIRDPEGYLVQDRIYDEIIYDEGGHSMENARFIAAASPDVILALLADITAAEERVRVLLSYADGMAHDLWADWEQEGGPLTSREEWEKVRSAALSGAAQEKGEAGS